MSVLFVNIINEKSQWEKSKISNDYSFIILGQFPHSNPVTLCSISRWMAMGIMYGLHNIIEHLLFLQKMALWECSIAKEAQPVLTILPVFLSVYILTLFLLPNTRPMGLESISAFTFCRKLCLTNKRTV